MLTKKQQDDQTKWEAESAVKQAFIETPKGKSLVKQTIKLMKQNTAKVKRAVKKKV